MGRILGHSPLLRELIFASFRLLGSSSRALVAQVRLLSSAVSAKKLSHIPLYYPRLVASGVWILSRGLEDGRHFVAVS
jgi:hypothetical protein